MCYKLGPACVQNWGSIVLLQIRENVVTNCSSFVIANRGKCRYKLGQVLQIRAIITNWGIALATFHLHCLVHRVKYGNPELGNTTQQILSTTRPCCNIEFIELFLFWVILITYNIVYIFVYIFIKLAIFILFLLSSTVMFFLHCMLKILRYQVDSFIEQSIKWCDISGCSYWIHLIFYAVYFSSIKLCVVFLSLAYRCVNQPRYFWWTYCGVFLQNCFSLWNNVVNLTWWN